MKRENIKKYTKIGLSVVLAGMTCHLFIIPTLFSNEKLLNSSLNLFTKNKNIEIQFKNPKLRTHLSPKFIICADNISLKKDSQIIFETKNLNTDFCLNINKLIVNKIYSDYLFADINGLMNLSQPKKEEKENPKKNGFKFDFYDSVLTLNDSKILYNINEFSKAEITTKLDIDNTKKDFRPIKFTFNTNIKNNNETLNLVLTDDNRVYIKNKKLYIQDCPIKINNSEILINLIASQEQGINAKINSKDFKCLDLYNLLTSNLIINNGKEMLASTKDFSGNFDFNFAYTDSEYNGKISLKNFGFRLVPLNNMPIILKNGDFIIDKNNIELSQINGYYGNSQLNKITGSGVIKDYLTNLTSEIVLKSNLNNDFAKNYLTPIVNIPIEIVGNAGSQLIIKTIKEDININFASRLKSGNDILIDGASLTPKNYDRAINSVINLKNNILKIEKIDYFIAQTIDKNSKIKPILSVNGIVDCSNPIAITKEIGLDIPRPLPSEFLNLFAGKKMFKDGTFSGQISYLNYGNYPTLKGNFKAENIKIPSEKIWLKNGQFTTDEETLHLVANGRFKRSKYTFKGDILNKLSYPFVIKDVELTLDNVDIEKLFSSMNSSDTTQQQTEENLSTENLEEGKGNFDIKNLIVEKCSLKLDKGKYKDIEIGNLIANLTLDKNQILDLSARRFNIADGFSSLKVHCDLNNKKYELKLGAKDVDADKMATSILNLKKEITGKASGFVNLYTDSSLKLNGSIKFNINNGSIQKIGLAEYLMKFAAIFRNPLVMISPSTISDIVNIPEGEFDKISGELHMENNVINLIRIKSTSPRLSSYVVGMYNLETNDAILRIYTKFSNKNKGFYGFIRNISLNSLANRFVKTNDTELNYYAAEISQIPPIEGEEKDCQIFLTKIDGDIQNNNFLSSLKKIK